MSKFDPHAFWTQYPEGMQNCIAAVAIVLFASFEAEARGGLSDEAECRWLHARETAFWWLRRIMHCTPDLSEGPDLACIDMRACRQCGCTNESACEGGCYWVEEDLCSKCEHQVAGHA